MVDYDGVFYWIGTDRFLMFNGVVREVPNALNLNYFFDGLNYSQRQKVFAVKVPRFGEIWWMYPRGDAIECTHAIIYNVRENTWYDTPLPNGGRSAAAVGADLAVMNTDIRRPWTALAMANGVANGSAFRVSQATPVTTANSRPVPIASRP